LLISCENHQLRTDLLVLEQQFAEVSAQRQGAWNEPVQIKIYDDELSRLNSELKESKARLKSLNIYAQAEGVWSVRNAVDLPGVFAKRGDLIGYVITNNNISVRGMISESDIELIRDRTVSMRALQTSDLSSVLTPVSWAVFPAATKEPVSAILTEAAGGSIMMNPSSATPQSLGRYFIIALEFDHFPSTYVEERIQLQFEHHPEPIIYRLYRLIRRTFLEYFDV